MEALTGQQLQVSHRTWLSGCEGTGCLGKVCCRAAAAAESEGYSCGLRRRTPGLGGGSVWKGGAGGCQPESLPCVDAQVEPAVSALWRGSAGGGGGSSTFCHLLPPPDGTICVLGSLPAFSCVHHTPCEAQTSS